MSDASPSNAGDRYHFVHVARRMLDMLQPESNLTLIQVENLSRVNQQLATHPEDLLGADLTAYYGGDSFATATFVEITQVKYSALRPNETWTLSRLSQNKQGTTGRDLPGTSVLRKLANVFSVAYGALGAQLREKVRIRLLSNQSLNETLARELGALKNELVQSPNLSDNQSGEVLRHLAGNGDRTAIALQTTTGLSWKRLSAFLRCWDLSAFGQPSAMVQETELVQLLDRYVDMGIQFGRLINFVQEHSVSNRRADIRKEQVYGLLLIRESSFFPAPSQFFSPDLLQLTNNVHELLAAIEGSSHPVVLAHGSSGTGKSSTLQLVQRLYGTTNAMIIYDCFGGGRGVGLDTGRFPFKTFFVQIINELAGRFQTNVYVTTQIDEDEIRRRFSEAIEKAARLAQNAGQRLVIAVDAIDDAVEAAREQPNRQDKSFVPFLWTVRWPDNCNLVVTSRTENNASVDIRCDYSEVEIRGFSEPETRAFLTTVWPGVPEDLLRYAHARTQGNPRVLSKLVESARRETPADLRQFIDTHAQSSAFGYYRSAVPRVLGDNQADWLLVATLREASQLITVSELSRIIERNPQDVQRVLGRLHFGLRVDESGEIQWPDKDFVSYLRQFAGDYVPQAQALLATFCLSNVDHNEYASQHLSRHLFRARRYEELVEWWMSQDRLAKRTAATEPHTEDASDDIQYTLLAAIELHDSKNALSVLVLAAEIAQGVDVFGSVVLGYPQIVAEQRYASRLLTHLRRHGERDGVAELFGLARSLAEVGLQPELAAEVFDHGYAAAERIKQESPNASIWSQEIVLDIALYRAAKYGLDAGLTELDRWGPRDAVAIGYAELAYAWSKQHNQENGLDIIRQHALEEGPFAYALLGILAAGNTNEATTRLLAEHVLDAARSGLISVLGQTDYYSNKQPRLLPHVLDTLIRNKLGDAAAEFIGFWSHRTPRSHDSVDGEFADLSAYRHFLGVGIISPDTFELDIEEGPEGTDPDRDRAKHSEENSRARQRLRVLLRPRQLRLEALADAPSEEILEATGEFLASLRNQTAPYWYNFFRSDVQSTGAKLMEAVALLPGDQLPTIRSIVETTEHVVGAGSFYGLTRYALVLSHHQKYQAEAEKLIYQRLTAIRPPEYMATDAVEALLELYPAALRVDPDLARQIFVRARIEAGSWDSRVDGSAYALLATLEHSLPDVTLTPQEMDKLVAIFRVIKKVTEGYDARIDLDWFIRLMTTIRPEYALAALFEFDKIDFVDLQSAIDGVALALLGSDIPAQAIYPLTHLLKQADQVIAIFERAIPKLDADAKDLALAKLSEYIQKETTRDRRYQYAMDMLAWAERNGLSQHPVIVAGVEFAVQLGSIKGEDTTGPIVLDASSDRGVNLLTQVETALSDSPSDALQCLLEADPSDLLYLRSEKLSELLATITDRLPSTRLKEILQVVERFNETSSEPRGFSLLAVVAEHTLPTEAARVAFSDSLLRMLTPGKLGALTALWYWEHLDRLLACETLNSPHRLDAILRAISMSLPELSANTLYRLIGALSRSLPSADSFAIHEMLKARAAVKVPPSYSLAIETYTLEDLYPTYISFLSDCLGHPDQKKCWLVLFALVDICINVPRETIPLLIGWLADKTHPRWMTKRVWLLILFHHLSLRIPTQLEAHLDPFISIALDSEFPHAIMRYHAQQVVRNVDAASPGTIDQTIMARIEAVNRPTGFINEQYSGEPVSSEGTDERTRWSFDWDTDHYWYKELGELFGGPRSSVSSVARKWIIEKLGFSEKDTTRDNDWVVSKYDYDARSNRHGSLPQVESLQSYAELHALYLAAGEFVDSQPVYVDKWSGQPRWDHFLRYDIRGLDPLLPIRYARPLPTSAEHCGVFDTTFEGWVKKDGLSEFESELWPDAERESVVVSGNFDGYSDDRRFSVIIDSYLVHPETAASLSRLLKFTSRFYRAASRHGSL
jgi:hypothetical protein